MYTCEIIIFYLSIIYLKMPVIFSMQYLYLCSLFCGNNSSDCRGKCVSLLEAFHTHSWKRVVLLRQICTTKILLECLIGLEWKWRQFNMALYAFICISAISPVCVCGQKKSAMCLRWQYSLFWGFPREFCQCFLFLSFRSSRLIGWWKLWTR